MGSKAFNAFARSSLLWAIDPEAEDANTPRRILAHAKQNLTEHQEALAFEVATRPIGLLNRRTGQHVVQPIAYLRHVGTSAATEEDMLSDGSDRKKVNRARAFLQEELYPPGHWAKSAVILQLANGEGIDTDTLRRAREQLGITRNEGNVRKVGQKGNVTEWRLPPDFLEADTEDGE